ncbi:mucin, putative, partial [Trypanosoma cruzi]
MMMTCRLLCALLVLALCCCSSVCVSEEAATTPQTTTTTTTTKPPTTTTTTTNKTHTTHDHHHYNTGTKYYDYRGANYNDHPRTVTSSRNRRQPQQLCVGVCPAAARCIRAGVRHCGL